MKQKGIYGKAALTAILTVCAILIFYDTFFGSRTLIALLKKLLDALTPILLGSLFAYLLAPVINFFDHLLFPAAAEKAKAQGKYCAPGSPGGEPAHHLGHHRACGLPAALHPAAGALPERAAAVEQHGGLLQHHQLLDHEPAGEQSYGGALRLGPLRGVL